MSTFGRQVKKHAHFFAKEKCPPFTQTLFCQERFDYGYLNKDIMENSSAYEQ